MRIRPCGVFDTNYKKDMAIIRTNQQWLLTLILIVVLLTMPFYLTEYWLSITIFIGITLIATLGLHIMTGLCGQISIGHASFMGIGAYFTAMLAREFALPIWITLPGAGFFTASVGLIFGIPALRIKGFYLAMSTLAAQFIIVWMITHLRSLTGGTEGISLEPATIMGLVFNSNFKFYYLMGFILAFMGFFARNLVRTKPGRIFIAIRDNDIAAEVMGINIFQYKLIAFFIGCFYAGIAGSLWAYYLTSLHPEQFSIKDSIWFLGMLIVGGLGSPIGVVFGTIFIRLLDVLVEFISPFLGVVLPGLSTQAQSSLSLISFGLVVIVFLVIEPRGLAHQWEIFKAYYRLWPYSY